MKYRMLCHVLCVNACQNVVAHQELVTVLAFCCTCFILLNPARSMGELVPFQSPGTPGPRRKAPDLEADGIAGVLENSFGPTLCQQACHGADLASGFQFCKEHNKADRHVIQTNIAVLNGLLTYNAGGIYRKSQIKDAFQVLDCKYRFQMSASSKDKVDWADQQSTVVHFCFQELRRMVRNLKTMGRTPAWLT